MSQASDFTVTTLGCGSARPSRRHLPSSTVVNHRGNLFMVDCGEGAQRSLMQYGLNMARVGHIFLTHLHGDHCFGLPGLVGTLGLQQTGGTLTIHTFEEGRRIFSDIFNYFSRGLPYEIVWNILDPRKEEIVLETRALTVRTIPLRHRVDCVGYIFEEKPSPRHLDRAMCDFHGVPMALYNRIKGGEDFMRPDGILVPNERLTTPPTPPRSYAHISDTAYMPALADKIRGVDLLFHETTYTEEHRPLAQEGGHSTAREAAMIARDAQAGSLLIGHYSSRYPDERVLYDEAAEIFPDVVLNHEGLTTPIRKIEK